MSDTIMFDEWILNDGYKHSSHTALKAAIASDVTSLKAWHARDIEERVHGLREVIERLKEACELDATKIATLTEKHDAVCVMYGKEVDATRDSINHGHDLYLQNVKLRVEAAKHDREMDDIRGQLERWKSAYGTEYHEHNLLKEKVAGMVCGTCKGDGYDPATGWDWVNNQYITLTPCMVCQPKKGTE
jgi:hypothetical protein